MSIHEYSIRFKANLPQKNGTIQQVYACCQSNTSPNNRPKKPRVESNRGQDARRMDRFHCNGLLYLTPRAGHIDCMLSHHLDHARYKDITIPEEWRQFIMDNYKLGPTKVCAHCFAELVITKGTVKIWREILQRTRGGRGIAFRQKAVRYYWICQGANVWKCADDPIESAREWCQRSGAQEDIEIIEMDSVPHSRAFAFVVKDFMEKWAANTDSFLVDSTCE